MSNWTSLILLFGAVSYAVQIQGQANWKYVHRRHWILSDGGVHCFLSYFLTCCWSGKKVRRLLPPYHGLQSCSLPSGSSSGCAAKGKAGCEGCVGDIGIRRRVSFTGSDSRSPSPTRASTQPEEVPGVLQWQRWNYVLIFPEVIFLTDFSVFLFALTFSASLAT